MTGIKNFEEARSHWRLLLLVPPLLCIYAAANLAESGTVDERDT
jgi:hypothetical protein